MIFKNKPNKCHTVIEKGKERIVWESRSVAVNLVVIAIVKAKPGQSREYDPFVLVSKRGPKAADFQGKLNIVAGYLDWDETGPEAAFREAWEECGINIPEFVKQNYSSVILNHLNQPWHVKTEPDENRQNISLRYGVALRCDELPTLTLKNNEIEGEVEDAWWMSINNIDDYEWAFNHDEVIKDYFKKFD